MTRTAPDQKTPWTALFLTAGLAVFLRLALYNGAFGSDDGTYYTRAQQIAQGIWTSAGYNGALRYGFNIPAGLLMRLFGDSIAMANLWPLLCSLSEVVAVGWMASTAFGRRAGLLAAVLLSVTPLHVAVATRIHADPVVAAALTWGVVLCYQGLRRGHAGLLFGAGVALGGVYWAKELAAVCYFGLLPLLYFFRARPRDVLVVLAGLALMLVLNGLLFWIISDHPLHGMLTVLRALNKNFVQGGDGRDEAWYYLPYLFFDLRHVALLGWLALLGLLRSSPAPAGPQTLSGKQFLVLWLLGMLAVLSLFPVSLHPLRFTLKQSNYLTLMLAPLAICAALGLEGLAGKGLRRGAVGLALLMGLVLAALQQADYRAFTAVSKAVAAEADRTGMVMVASVNNVRMATELAQQAHKVAPRMFTWGEAKAEPAVVAAGAQGGEVVIVLDPQTGSWPAAGALPEGALPCWREAGVIEPIDLGLGNRLAGLFATLAQAVHAPESARMKLDKLAQPRPASLWTVPAAQLLCSP